MMTPGADVLDALMAGVSIVELDPKETGVGWGGLPNAEGVVQLDSCCMHGPKKRAGGSPKSKASGRRRGRPDGYRGNRSSPAGRQGRAGLRAQHGLQDRGRPQHRERAQQWLEWKRRTDPLHYLDPKKRAQAGPRRPGNGAEGLIDPEHYYGTINCDGINAKGEICGVTTTSGLAWKIPGRAGDSPILGAGLYVDGEVGAAGSTGRGEANLYNLCLVRDRRRDATRRASEGRGGDGAEARREEHDRKAAAQHQGRPNFGLNFYCLNAKGEYAGVSMYESTYAVCTENGAQTLKTEALFDGSATD